MTGARDANAPNAPNALNDVLALLALPPPTHGQSIVNAAIAARLSSTPGIRAQIVDIGPGRLIRGLLYHLRRVSRITVALAQEIRHCSYPDRTIYTVLDSGWGIVYNFAIVGLARVLRFRIVLHHHTAAHTLATRPVFRRLAQLAGRDAVHVVLSPAMAADLKSRYPCVRRIIAVHNAGVVPAPSDVPRLATALPLLRLGFLSNLSDEKGLDVALEVLRAGRRSGLDLVLRLAGPITTGQAAAEIERAKAECGTALEIHGPVAGTAKEEFFDGIDVFLFPSRYRFEAQPLVVVEAMGHGCALIVNDCGYIAELVDGAAAIVTNGADFVQTALDLCRRWSTNPKEMQVKGRAARARYMQLRQIGEAELDDLIATFLLAKSRSCIGNDGAGEPK